MGKHEYVTERNRIENRWVEKFGENFVGLITGENDASADMYPWSYSISVENDNDAENPNPQWAHFELYIDDDLFTEISEDSDDYLPESATEAEQEARFDQYLKDQKSELLQYHFGIEKAANKDELPLTSMFGSERRESNLTWTEYWDDSLLCLTFTLSDLFDAMDFDQFISFFPACCIPASADMAELGAFAFMGQNMRIGAIGNNDNIAIQHESTLHGAPYPAAEVGRCSLDELVRENLVPTGYEIYAANLEALIWYCRPID